MNPYLAAFISAITNVAFIGVAAYIGRAFFQQVLARDVENYKAKLQAENDLARMRLQHELEARLFEYQTRLSFFHPKRAEVTIELYGMLTDTFEWMKNVVNPLQVGSDETHNEQIAKTSEKYNALATHYLKHKP